MDPDDRTAPSTSDYSSSFAGEATEETNSPSGGRKTNQSVRSVILLGSFVACAIFAWAGATALFFSLLARYIAPPKAYYEQSLYFDYTKADAVATTHFLPDAQFNRAKLSDATAASSYFLPSRQRFDLWLELAVAEAHGQMGDELFQVRGELFTADGRSIANASRPCLVRQRYWISRTARLWLNAPFVILGLWDERRELKVHLFSNTIEDSTAPFAVFKATLQASAGGGRLPQLYEAKAHVQLKFSLFGWLLYRVRPNGFWLAGSILTMVGGGVGTITVFSLWLVSRSSTSNVASIRRANRPLGTSDTDGDLSGDESISPEEFQRVEQEIEDEDRRNQRRRRAYESGIGSRPYPSSQQASQLGNDARGQFYKTATFAQPSRAAKKLS